MHAFTDAQGREWPLVVTVGAIKRVRDLLGVDLLEVATGNLLGRLAEDPVLLADVLFALVKPEADARGVSDEEFGRGLAGDVFDRAGEALVSELLAFFPLAQRAAALGKMVREAQKRGALLEEAIRLTRQTQGGETRQTDGGQVSGVKSGASPASSDATPQTGP